MNCRMSWPDLACASAAIVSRSLSPFEVMKSIVMSTFSLAAHSRQSCSSGSFAVRHPVVPEAAGELAGRIGAANEGRRQRGRGKRRRLQDRAPRQQCPMSYRFASSIGVYEEFPSSIDVLAAIDEDLRRGDVGGVLAAQEKYRARDVFGLAEPVERDARQQ